MTPIAVKKLFAHHDQLTIEQVKDYFAIDSSFAKQLVDFWLVRGYLLETHCGMCSKRCITKVVYQWRKNIS